MNHFINFFIIFLLSGREDGKFVLEVFAEDYRSKALFFNYEAADC